MVDVIEIVAAEADQGICAAIRRAEQRVGAGGAGRSARANEVERLDISRHGVIDRRHHEVGAAVRDFGHHVADVVDVIEIVAAEADQRIGAAGAEQNVGAARAGAGQPVPTR